MSMRIAEESLDAGRIVARISYGERLILYASNRTVPDFATGEPIKRFAIREYARCHAQSELPYDHKRI